MSSCTNTWAQRKSGRNSNTPVSNPPSYALNVETLPTSTEDHLQDQRRHDKECRDFFHYGNQSIDSESIVSDGSIDGVSLDTSDWMELVARGAVSNKELEEVFLPITIDLNGYYDSDLNEYTTAVSIEDQSQISSDDSWDTTGKDWSLSDEMELEEPSTSDSEMEHDDCSIFTR